MGVGIPHVVAVSSHSRAKPLSILARGGIGYKVLGVTGLLAGATAKRNDYITLVVHYRIGLTKTIRTRVGSMKFRKYARYTRN